jgi:hypothetical protein
MAKRIHASIRVVLDPDGAVPLAFHWGERRYRIDRVEACWKQVGAWWDGEGERTCFRVTTEEGIYEITHDHPSGCWMLVSILD